MAENHLYHPGPLELAPAKVTALGGSFLCEFYFIFPVLYHKTRFLSTIPAFRCTWAPFRLCSPPRALRGRSGGYEGVKGLYKGFSFNRCIVGIRMWKNVTLDNWRRLDTPALQSCCHQGGVASEPLYELSRSDRTAPF